MGVAENPNKVNNIVASNLTRFSQIYRPLYPLYGDFLSFDTLSSSFKVFALLFVDILAKYQPSKQDLSHTEAPCHFTQDFAYFIEIVCKRRCE